MRILVTGATGGVGRCVVRQLLDSGSGVTVRALTRDPARADFPAGVEVVRGDLEDPASLRGVFDGVDRMHVFPVEDTAAETIALARAAGVSRATVLSAAAVTTGHSVNPVEQIVEDSGMEWTHVRPGEFMTNKLHLWGPSVRAERVVRYPFPDEQGVPVHEEDVATMIVAGLLEDRHVGKAYTLTGPTVQTVREQVAAIGAALGEEVRFEEVTREQARELMKAQGGFAAEHADMFLGYADYDGSEASGEDGYSEEDWSELLKPWPDFQEATGRPPRDFAQWARDRADDFR
jgi:uncharacterized protein YbjT (DUF2867 family)